MASIQTSNHLGPIDKLFRKALDALNGQQYGEAESLFGRVLKMHPDHVGALNLLAILLMRSGRHKNAEKYASRALALDQSSDASYYNYGLILKQLNKPEQAVKAFTQALAINPNVPQSWNNRGTSFNDLEQYQSAIDDFDRALAIDRNYAEAYFNKGNSLFRLKRYVDAFDAYDRALGLNPTIEGAMGLRFLARATVCDWSDYSTDCALLAQSLTAQTIACEPFIFLVAAHSPDEQLRCARKWVTGKSAGASISSTYAKRRRRDKIHVAYLSADFRDHPISHLAAGLFEHHDGSRFCTTGISLAADDHSAIGQRVRGSFGELIDAERLTDEEAIELIKSKEIDILVDLTGLTGGSRIRILSHRAAPIQVNYLGYPGSMGSAQMDYIIADHVLIPQQHQVFYDEKIVYLPHSYQANDRKREISDRHFSRDELGLPSSAFVFCCFNNSFKIAPSQFDRWMNILKQVDGSVLWLLEANEAAGNNLRKEAERRGVDPNRLVFAQRMPMKDHLARHRAADLFLDTLPYNAHTTASDALWAGLPVLTEIGGTFAARVGASLLQAVGLPELITATSEQYQGLAIELARNPAKLRAIKAKLSGSRLTAPLFNTELTTRHIEFAYQQMFDRNKAGLPPDHIEIPHLLAP